MSISAPSNIPDEVIEGLKSAFKTFWVVASPVLAALIAGASQEHQADSFSTFLTYCKVNWFAPTLVVGIAPLLAGGHAYLAAKNSTTS